MNALPILMAVVSYVLTLLVVIIVVVTQVMHSQVMD